MAIYLNPREAYWFAPLQEGFQRGVLLGIQEALRKQRGEERLKKLTELGQSIAEQMDLSPTNTYVVDQPQFSLEAPQMDISPTLSVKQKIGEGLLSSSEIPSTSQPQQSSFVDVIKDPAEYAGLMYQKTLPFLAQAAGLGVNLSPAVNNMGSLLNGKESFYQLRNW